jgi:cyclase
MVTVRQGWAVQSFGYRRHLPLGKPEVLVENLDRWGADEIVVQCVDRALGDAGPDLKLLERISRLGLSTPLIYSGGIRTVEQGVAAVKAGADRICIDSILHDDVSIASGLSAQLGAQAVIAAIPLSLDDGKLGWLDHRDRSIKPLSPDLLETLRSGAASEVLLIDWRHEGHPGGFEEALIDAFPASEVPIIAFGGLSDADTLRSTLLRPAVVAVALGNFLSYREHAVQEYKKELAGLPLRPPHYQSLLGTAAR